MTERRWSLSTVWVGAIFAALFGGSAYFAFAAGNAVVGGLFTAIALVALAGSLRRPARQGPDLRTHIVWSGLGFLVLGAALVAVSFLDESPNRVLAGLAGVIFLGLAVAAGILWWKYRNIEQPADEPVHESNT